MVTTTPLCIGVSLVTAMIGELCIDIQSYLNNSLFSIVHMQSKGTTYYTSCLQYHYSAATHYFLNNVLSTNEQTYTLFLEFFRKLCPKDGDNC